MRISVIAILVLSTSVFAQPYQPQVIWDRSGLTDTSAYATRILPLGDQNDDGLADWAVYTGFDNGRALEFYHGSPVLPTEPYHVFHLDTAVYLWWGSFIIGDMNGDGYEDWILSLGRRPSGTQVDNAIFLGGPTASDTPEVVFSTAFPSLPVFARDFNADGFDDLFFQNYQSGSLWVYYGGSPMDTLPDWVLHQPPPGINQTYPYAWGDFNGDGATDFILFYPNPPYNWAVFLGGSVPDTVPAYFWSNMTGPKDGIDSLNGDQYDDFPRGHDFVNFGRPVLSPIPDVTLNSVADLYAADAGDFNGDGYHDLISYTTSTLNNPFGALDLHLGAEWLNPDPAFAMEGNEPPYDLRGIYGVVGLGDVNGDGLGDFAIGVFNETFWRRGRCVIIAGDTLRVSANPARPELPHDITIQAYPNPFNSESTVKLTLPWSERLNEMTIYNALGQRVRHEMLPPFVSEVTYQFDARDLATGTYLLEVRSGTLSKSQKLILLR